jgi:putative ABC transport system permease protein
MLKNYLIIGFRNIWKHFSYSMINIFGLGLGLATCLLLTVWITHELSYDKFHKDADRIYRSSLEMNFGGQHMRTAVSPTALLPALKSLPEVEEGVRVYNASARNPFIVKKHDVLFQETHFYFVDSTFFKVFSFELVKGSAGRVLKEPYSVILTESMAKKYFDKEDPIGKTLQINNSRDYTVTGVIKDAPSNAYLQFDFLASFSSLPQANEPPSWWSANYQTFVKLHDKASITTVTTKTYDLVKKALAAELTNPGDDVRYSFMKLTDIHLQSDLPGEIETTSDITYVYIFSGVALLILIIACINYINLATARAADRAKEVGIRKVAGAMRKQLFIQFLGESVLLTLIAFLLAFVVAQIMLPFFNDITGKHLEISLFYDPTLLAMIVLVLIVIAFLSGAYPAFAITAFKPVSVLKGSFKFSGRGIWLRKTLVVTQFSISMILIVGTLVILKQLNFIQNKKLGYDKENIIVLPLDKKTGQVFSQLKSEFMRSGRVSGVGLATESPTKIQGGYGFNLEGKGDSHGMILTAVAADTGYFNALGMEIIEGRHFNEVDFNRVKADTFYSFIVNEATLGALFIEKENAIGTRARLSGRQGEIVGVVKDFHFNSLHNEIGPLVIFSQEDYNYIFVKLKPGNLNESLATLKSICGSIIPHRPFEYQFLDQQYDAMYTSEQRMGTIFLVFASLAIIIACLGLLGLVSFSAAQKTKEIGIRKVLGATASSIVLLITKDFAKLVFVAIVIGIPAAYWLMNQWLSGFAYQTEIGILPVVIASIVSIFIALSTAGYQAIKAALIDPARTLRNE